VYYLNTTRHLKTPASDETVAQLLKLLDTEILPKASTLQGMRSIQWMLSTDAMTLQAFSGWNAEGDLDRAQNSAQHTENGLVINDLLGGLSQPQGHSYYRELSRFDIR
jgi:hypothetical protein